MVMGKSTVDSQQVRGRWVIPRIDFRFEATAGRPPPVILMTVMTGLVLGVLCAFQPPGPEERLKAIGPTGGLSEGLRRALDPGRGFEPMNAPGPSDWLASHVEEGQTYEDFSKSKPLRPE